MGTKNDISEYFAGEIDTSILLDLDANSNGNTNAKWIDLSLYNRLVAAAINEQPILTSNVFGVGNFGYLFDGANDIFCPVGSADFSFCTTNGDLPYSIYYKLKFNNISTRSDLTFKSGTFNEYELVCNVNQLVWNMYTAIGGYIATRKTYSFVNDVIYDIVFTYDALNAQNGTNIYVNKVLQTGLTRINSNYTHMSPSNGNLRLGGGGSSNTSLDGYLGKLKIFNKCLAQSDINNL